MIYERAISAIAWGVEALGFERAEGFTEAAEVSVLSAADARGRALEVAAEVQGWIEIKHKSKTGIPGMNWDALGIWVITTVRDQTAHSALGL
jgi:hypothetical protein